MRPKFTDQGLAQKEKEMVIKISELATVQICNNMIFTLMSD